MDERYGPKVRWLRTELRLTGRELCRRVAISPAYLSDIEMGRRLPAPEVSDRIADALGIDRDALWRLALLERLSERDLRTLIPALNAALPAATFFDEERVVAGYVVRRPVRGRAEALTAKPRCPGSAPRLPPVTVTLDRYGSIA